MKSVTYLKNYVFYWKLTSFIIFLFKFQPVLSNLKFIFSNDNWYKLMPILSNWNVTFFNNHLLMLSFIKLKLIVFIMWNIKSNFVTLKFVFSLYLLILIMCSIWPQLFNKIIHLHVKHNITMTYKGIKKVIE